MYMYVGSAVFKSLTPALVSSIIYLILYYLLELEEEGNEILEHPYPMGALVAAFTFLLAFRANFSYNRYWEALGHIHQMHSKWLDFATEVAAFHYQAERYDAFKPPAFGAHPATTTGVSTTTTTTTSTTTTTNTTSLLSCQHRERERTAEELTKEELEEQIEAAISMQQQNEQQAADAAQEEEEAAQEEEEAAAAAAEDSNPTNTSSTSIRTTLPSLRSRFRIFRRMIRNGSRRTKKKPTTTNTAKEGEPRKQATGGLDDSKEEDEDDEPDFTSHTARHHSEGAVLFHKQRQHHNTSKATTSSLRPIHNRRTQSVDTLHNITNQGRSDVYGRPITRTTRNINQSLDNSGRLFLRGNRGGEERGGKQHKQQQQQHKKKKTRRHDDNAFVDEDGKPYSTFTVAARKRLRAGGLETNIPALFLEEAAHLLSLLSAVALSTLRNDLEEAESPLIAFTPGAPWPHADPDNYSADVRKGWSRHGAPGFTVVRYLCGVSRNAKTRTLYNAARPFRVIGNVSDAEIDMLQAARGPLAKVALCSMWLQEFLSREYLSGSTGKVAPPIISRLYQFTSDGMSAYVVLFVVLVVGFTGRVLCLLHGYIILYFIYTYIYILQDLLFQFTVPVANYFLFLSPRIYSFFLQLQSGTKDCLQ
jgi:nucleoid-associated protein YgaU